MSLRYRDAGVDLDAAEAVTARIAERLGNTLFGGFVPVPQLKAYDVPVLVSSIDGVGTKVRLAARLDRLEGLGDDIVHHCVNDIAVHGASPLFFLDYLAFHRLDPRVVERIVSSIAAACDRLNVRLAGGETAEMPLVYAPGEFDIAGAVVGVVEQADILDGADIKPGDVLVGLPAPGLHTNGYSLVQRLFGDQEYDRHVPELGTTLGEALLEPHPCYLNEIRDLTATGTVRGMAHITGGGIIGNLSRIMPPSAQAVVDLPPLPPLFTYLQGRGIPWDEMVRVFNMGVGLIAVCESTVSSCLPPGCQLIGTVEPGERKVVLRDEYPV